MALGRQKVYKETFQPENSAVVVSAKKLSSAKYRVGKHCVSFHTVGFEWNWHALSLAQYWFIRMHYTEFIHELVSWCQVKLRGIN